MSSAHTYLPSQIHCPSRRTSCPLMCWWAGELVSGQLILSFTLNAHWVVYENRFLANIFSFNEAFSHEIFLLCAPWRLLLLLDTMKLQINSSSARTLASNTNVHRVAAQRRQFVQCKLGKRAESKSQKHFYENTHIHLRHCPVFVCVFVCCLRCVIPKYGTNGVDLFYGIL